jgi:hypothetical protein
MKEKVKEVLSKSFPSVFSVVQSIRSRRLIERYCLSDGSYQLAELISQIADQKVQDGIFHGMIMNPMLFRQHMSPKILGTYEDEVYSFLSSIAGVKIGKVINIGCAEGYYAIGSARLWPEAAITAFDLDPVARRATERHAKLNNVDDRVSVRSRATRENICLTLGDSDLSLMIVDCEGAEFDLISPADMPALKRSYFIVELHPHIVSNVERVMIERLRSTHDVKVIYPEPKNIDRYRSRVWFEKFSDVDLERAVNEHRGFTPWLLAVPLIPFLD